MPDQVFGACSAPELLQHPVRGIRPEYRCGGFHAGEEPVREGESGIGVHDEDGFEVGLGGAHQREAVLDGTVKGAFMAEYELLALLREAQKSKGLAFQVRPRPGW